MTSPTATPTTPLPNTLRHAEETFPGEVLARSFFVSHVLEAAVDDVVVALDQRATDRVRRTCGLVGVYRCAAAPPHANTPWRVAFREVTLLCVCRTAEVALALQHPYPWGERVAVTPAAAVAREVAGPAAEERVLNTFLSREQAAVHLRPTNVDEALQRARQSHRLYAALLSGRTRMWPDEVLGRAALVEGTAVVVDEATVAAAYLRYRRNARSRRSAALPTATPPRSVRRAERDTPSASSLRPRMAGSAEMRRVSRRLEVSPRGSESSLSSDERAALP